MWSDLGLGELWVVCLDKNTNKNRVNRNRRNRPWRPASSYGRYGAPLPAIKHTTINYYSILWVGIVKSRKNINFYCLVTSRKLVGKLEKYVLASRS